MRNRIVKEGFFRNYELAQLSPLTRLLFEGLWLLADRDGRLLDRPPQIKVEVLPYDDCDVNGMLDQLHEKGFIKRYEAAGKRCIEVVNFHKHQSLTSWEKGTKSEIPSSEVLRKSYRRRSDRSEQSRTEQSGRETAERASARGDGGSAEAESEGKTEVERIALPPWLPRALWLRWCTYKRERREKFTLSTATGQIKRLGELRDAGQPPEAVIEQSITQGWQGLFELKQAAGNGRAGRAPTTQQRNVERLKQKLDQEKARAAGDD